ncbi:unnamed protein product, partial [Prorocentrum cordatum]
AVEALNGLSGAGVQGGSLPRAGATLAQQQCLMRIADSVSQLAPPPGDLQPLAALQELQAALSYDGSLSTRAEAMDVSRLSLPPPGFFDSVYRDISARSFQILEFLQRKQRVGFKKPYSDPSLRDPRRYAALVMRLHDAGVVDLVSDAALVVDEVGLFSVAKKSGRQRLVVDARPANFWFGDPEGVHLATGAALAAIELPDGANPWTASADIADAFYNVQLSEAWRPCFALVSEAAADRAGLLVLSRIADRPAGPSLGSGAHLVYVDNFASLALDGDTADRLKDDMLAELRSEGFLVHEEEAASLHAQVSAQQVRQVVGNYTFLFMVKRPLLAAYSAVYRFIAKAGEAPRAPWGQLIEPLEPLEAYIYSEPSSKGHLCNVPSDIQEPVAPMDNGSPRAEPQETDFEPLEVHRISGDRVVISSGAWEGEKHRGALVEAGGVAAALRWIPSEANPADLPSRRALRQQRGAPAGRRLRSEASAGLSKAAEAAAKRAGRAAARAPGAAALRASAGHVLRALSISATTRVTVALRTETADDLLAHWIDKQYAEGWNPEHGAYMQAALKFMMPQFGRGGQGLPKALQALRGWRKRVPARARLPLPWEIVALIATRLIDRDLLRVALYVLVTFAGYLRPSEALRALGAHLIPPTLGCVCDGWSLVLHPRELAVPSKTQVYDEVTPFDLPFYSFLPGALRWLKASTHLGEPLFPFTLVRVSFLFKEAADDMGLASLTPQLCQLRHSGPSVELALQLRTLANVELRGRWRTDASVARYLEPGRVNEHLQRLAPEVQRAALLAPVSSGEGVLAAALRSDGPLVIDRDIAWGADWDLTDPKVSRVLRGWLNAGLIWCMHFGVPCETWSRVRDTRPLRVPGGPPSWPSRPRSDSELWGLAAVTHPADRAQIMAAN